MIKWMRSMQQMGCVSAQMVKSKSFTLLVENIFICCRIYCGYNGEFGFFYTNAPGRDYTKVMKFDKKSQSGLLFIVLFIHFVDCNRTSGYYIQLCSIQCMPFVSCLWLVSKSRITFQISFISKLCWLL